jgi:hypothetical protein
MKESMDGLDGTRSSIERNFTPETARVDGEVAKAEVASD